MSVVFLPLLIIVAKVTKAINLFRNILNFTLSKCNSVAFIRRNINILFVFILPVYFYIVQNSIQNKHTHVHANGIVITHSHPFDSDNDKPISAHEHSKTEICLYSSLHLDYYTLSPLFNFKIELNERHKKFFIRDEQVDSNSSFLTIIPRGPPV